MVSAGVAMVLLVGFMVLAIAAWVAGDAMDRRRRARWDRDWKVTPPPYDWERDGI